MGIMDIKREYLIKLTLGVYKVTTKFPENEPLKQKIRDKADNVLALLVSHSPDIDKKELTAEIEPLLAFFEIAKEQKWVDAKNFLILSQEYGKIRDFSLEKAQKPVKSSIKREFSTGSVEKPQTRISLNPSIRQQKIIEITKNRGEVRLSELRGVFSDITPRTLRRDLRALVEKGLIKRIRAGKEDVLFVLP